MNSKRILVVDDNAINRTVLGKILEADYQVIFAENGQIALDILCQEGSVIDAVLLDLVMPVLNGFGFLAQVQKQAAFANIPIVVTTEQGGEDNEVLALSLGAADFLTKPYKPAIIQHRLANLIKFRETAAFINMVERDSLTGLYNKEAFYKRATDLLNKNTSLKYALLFVDIERFKLVNDLFGIEEGDKLLQFVAGMVAKVTNATTSVCGRLTADNFMICLPHQDQLDREIVSGFVNAIKQYPLDINLILRVGVYVVDQAATSINVMCDRAKLAIESIKGKYDQYLAYYDVSLRNKLLEEQEIINSMRQGLEQGEFQVYLQPKYDLASETINGAEALVRWLHPQKGLLLPDMFIPLFEKNGFITNLDVYVWHQVCAKIRCWLDQGIPIVPISVNVSRVDIYNPNLPQLLHSILDLYHLTTANLQLEITETAYTENPKQLIDIINILKNDGFVIEMDDFGSGYSSLNMLNEVPVSILKLDMRFLQNSCDKTGKNILNFVISLAKWLDLTIVAEGIENEEQVIFLRNLNCHSGQGYYFARPMPFKDFEQLLLTATICVPVAAGEVYSAVVSLDDIWDPISPFNNLFNGYIGALSVCELVGEELIFIRANDNLFAMLGADLFQDSLAILPFICSEDREALLAQLKLAQVSNGEFVIDVRFSSQIAPVEYTWLHVRMKVIYHSGEKTVFFASMEDITARKHLEKELVLEREFSEKIYDIAPSAMAQYSLTDNPQFLSVNLAMIKMLGFESKEQFFAQERYYFDYVKPQQHEELKFVLEDYVQHYVLGQSEPVTLEFELVDRFGHCLWVSVATQIIPAPQGNIFQCVFTDISEFKKKELSLLDQTKRDPLTGLLNRVAFKQLAIDAFAENVPGVHAFMMLDLDDFKNINDTYGHLHGDRALKVVADILSHVLRNDDLVARFGGDEFAVLLKNIPCCQVAIDKAHSIINSLSNKQSTDTDVPINCSIGIAMYPKNGTDFNALYQMADTALYKAKNSGKQTYCCCCDEVKVKDKVKEKDKKTKIKRQRKR